MTQNPQFANLPLMAFFNGLFLPLQLSDHSPAYCEQFKTAIGWLAATLGREPTLADFNRQTMSQFVAKLATLGLAPLTMRNVRRRLWSLWKYAHSLKYVEKPVAIDGRRKVPKICRHGVTGFAYVTINGKRHYLGKHGSNECHTRYLTLMAEFVPAGTLALPPEEKPMGRAWNVPKPPVGSLLHFYRSEFRPILRPQSNSADLSIYDCAINNLHDWLNSQVALAEVTPEFVQAFRTFLDDRPLSPKLRSAYATAVKRIMRASAFADRFPKRDGQDPQSTVGHVERERRDLPFRPYRPNHLPPLVGEQGTLVHFYTDTYLPQVLTHSSSKYRAKIVVALRQLRSCFGRDLLLNELSREHISEFEQWMRERGDQAISTKDKVSCVMSLWRFADELNLAPPAPRLRRVRFPREAPDAWSFEEMQLIFDAATKIKRGRPLDGVPACKFWPAILRTCYWTALRRGSLLKIRPADVNLEKGTLYVPGSQMKNARGKIFHLGPDAVAAIREIYDANRERLFPFTDVRVLSTHFGLILKAAGVPPSRCGNNQFHKLRRTTITHTAVLAGMQAAITLAGHSSGIVTERYLDPSFLPNHDARVWLPTIADLPQPKEQADGNS
jgi:integrase